jgi:hypothetical protein
MRKLIAVVILLMTITSYSQEVSDYAFDENISLNVLVETEEGELPYGKYIRGVFETEVVTFSSSTKAKDMLATADETSLVKLFQGVREGNLKATKGVLLSEEIINLKQIKVAKFKISFAMEGENKIMESYVFAYKNIVYTFQFMNNEKAFEKLNNFRKSIIDSVQFN